MIEQVLEEGGGGGGGVDVMRGCAAIFESVFQSYYVFASVFFNSPMPSFGLILPIFHIFVVYYVYFIKKSNSVLDTKFL